MNAPGILDLWDWRRRMAELYAQIRAEPDPVQAWHLWCRTRNALFASHPQSPIDPAERAGYAGIPVYPYDSALRCLVHLRDASGTPLTLPAGDDGDITANPFARTEGLQAIFGGELTLFWIGGYGGGVFLPFTDATSGQGSYGGGRYLLDTLKSADLGQSTDGRTILDFNFAYAPSCAHSPRFICPLAPVSNRLPGAVRGGEHS